ncbi:MAG: histidine phosphatase family protein [Gemmatimonadota bacterium]|nr:histidine phosphatase family protein [Gemmatimonadota bacterium]MDH3421605.1 histidine phosphatase family protein [Gemmatimonadota bacterium]
MSRLLLIRHGQATFSPHLEQAFEDYDRLSELGLRQSRALGEELASAGVLFDRVYGGPLERQRQTAEAVAEAYAQQSKPWPGITELPELAEHQGSRVVRHALSSEPEHEQALHRLSSRAGGDGQDVERMRMYFTIFRRVTRQWARGEIVPPDVPESWQAFRARVGVGVARVLAEAGRGATVAAFTSGGPVGSTVAWALGLNDEQALELAWLVENATVTELLFSEGQVSLKSFNAQPRLGASDMVTGV